MLREGVLTTVDGLQHKFAFPGFETQAPPGMGLTATYHIGQNLRKDHAVLLCDITQIVAVNGKVEAKIPQADAVKVILAHVIP